MNEAAAKWPEDFAERYRAEGYWQGTTFSEFLHEQAHNFGDTTAIVDGVTRTSYAQLNRQASALAGGLRDLGIEQGDRVIIQLPNCGEFVTVWFALQRLGAIPVHAQPGHRRAEIAHLARMTEAVAYVTTDLIGGFDHRALAAGVADSHESIRAVLVVGDLGEYRDDARFFSFASVARGDETEGLAGHRGTASVSSSDIALLLLSGGTTGMPKLIARTHDDYLYNSRAAGERSGLGPSSIYLAVLPIAFNFTWNCPGILGTIYAGGTVVLSQSPDPAHCFELIERERVTMTAINPQLAPAWLAEKSFTDRDLSSLKVLEIGSARLSDHTAREIVANFDCTLQQILGMSEGLFCANHLDDDSDILCSAQGVPVSPADEVRVVDENGREVPNGEAGELTTRGPYTLRGYWGAAELNDTAFTPDGFYRTGDLVRQSDSGHLTVVGRIKEQINRGGEKIAPAEVEGHLIAHPTIVTVAVVGLPDNTLGERTVAVVVTDGRAAPTRRELSVFLAEAGLAAYKSPDRVVRVDTMPLTPLGKIDKGAVRRLLDADTPAAIVSR